MRIVDGNFYKEIDIKDGILTKLIHKYQLKTICKHSNEQNKVIAYDFKDEFFLRKLKKSKNKWDLILSMSFIDAKVFKRDFFKALGVNYIIKPLSNIATEEMIKTDRIELEETIYAPMECHVLGFDKKEGVVSFYDYVEGMDIEDKYFKYNIGTFFLFKEAFYKDKDARIIYKYPNSVSSIKYERSMKMNLHDIRYVGKVTGVKYERNRRMIRAIYKVEVEKIK